MRELTAAEYRVALAALALPGATDRDQIHSSGLASSTFHVARRRILGEGWLSEGPVPVLGPWGIRAVEIVLSRPNLTERADRIRAAEDDPACVHLWAGLHCLFSVHFRRSGPGVTRGEEAPGDLRILLDAGEGELPVYFDFSGSWARFGRLPRPEGYPRGLAIRGPPGDRREWPEARRLFEVDGPSGRPSGDPGETARPRREGSSWYQWRAFVDPIRVPPFEGRRLAEVLFLFGKLRPGRAGSGLLNALMTSCGSYPFFFASSARQVLLLGLGQTDARAPGRRPVPSVDRPVLPVLAEWLEDPHVVVEPLESIDRRIDRGYARALAPPAAGPDAMALAPGRREGRPFNEGGRGA